MRFTADDVCGGCDHRGYQTAIRRAGIFPDAACRPASSYNIYTDISDGFDKGNGKICEQQTFEFFASGDCCDCNRAEYSIAFCIDRKNRIRRKKNRALYRNRLGFFVSIIRLQRKRQRFLSQETSFWRSDGWMVRSRRSARRKRLGRSRMLSDTRKRNDYYLRTWQESLQHASC